MENINKKLSPFIVAAVIIVLALIIFGSRMFKTLQPGERGVVFKPLTTGLDKDHIFTPGFKVIAPWNTLHIYNVKEQQSEETMDILDKNGLSINMDVSVRFNPVYDKIGFLHETFGQAYLQQLVKPEVRSSVRKVAGRFSAEEIYSTKRKEVEDQIIIETKTILERNYIEMRALLIKAINLPTNIMSAIETKLTTEQEALAYQFKLEREVAEAERKRIAAEGEAAANKIINSSLTPSLLKMRGIETPLQLASSPNSKIIIIGSGKDGLPLILNAN